MVNVNEMGMVMEVDVAVRVFDKTVDGRRKDREVP